ncbi:hypothetical protein CesoFtcFv8_018737 [Champsocephalus esox]|uniref:Uncharacterized protein n=1 Tax=Champsocephalus esox TaxID=159716 RepID=A0AAN8GPF1_9TELE|nr:hypothetical protein CesoFtcFv8_018737 [Champsocephalus esox]
MGTGRATRGGQLARNSLPMRVAGDQRISTSGSQEEPPVCDLPLCSTPRPPPSDVNLNGSQVGKKCRERGWVQEQGGVKPEG